MPGEASIDGLRLLARGGQADIYEYGEGKVLRVARRAQDFDRIRIEYAVYTSLAGTELAVPRVYELLSVAGAPAIVMDRIPGHTMMAEVARNPLGAGAIGRELARLHREVGATEAPGSIASTKSKSDFCITSSKRLSERSKELALDLLHGLPDGENLCHGDFHPGNIIRHGGRSYLIDWVGASRGDVLADVAHTYLLLRVVPRVPHMSSVAHFLQTRVARAIGSQYLAEMARIGDFDHARFSKWLLVNAAERTYHGLESEQGKLATFVAAGLEDLRQGRSIQELYTTL